MSGCSGDGVNNTLFLTVRSPARSHDSSSDLATEFEVSFNFTTVSQWVVPPNVGECPSPELDPPVQPPTPPSPSPIPSPSPSPCEIGGTTCEFGGSVNVTAPVLITGMTVTVVAHTTINDTLSLTDSQIVLGNSIVVLGELQLTDTVIHASTTTGLTVTGCVESVGGSFNLTLSDAEIEELGGVGEYELPLLNYNSSCALPSITGSVATEDSCTAATGTRTVSNPGVLAMRFTLVNICEDGRMSDGLGIWVYVLIGVGGLLVILVVVVLVVPALRNRVFSFRKRAKESRKNQELYD
eukprot:TRINITY_DN7896_c0_g1_i1.p1 TRINITY_DN7896_c0_g1~~TRINITY_DN7896_c0_g1_i1.p1  ORF type:complete len:318 (-),score=58.66 TRINITY_DN7896_c0_g1_i1:322-1209(-)